MAAMTPDKMTKAELAKSYGYAYRIIKANPELFELFQKASSGKNNWSPARFQAALMGTDWWKNNSQYARDTWVAQQAGGQDWQDQIGAAKESVRQRAVALGFELDDATLDDLAYDYLSNGWYDGSRAGMLDQAIGAAGKGVGGEFVDVGEQLRRTAVMNGLDYNEGWFASAAKSVASGLTTVQDWEQDMREQAAQMFPVFADKIRAGMDAYDLASPYINRMAQTLEIDPNEIKLNDSYIKQAIGGMDDKGNPVAMNLWDFEKQLRLDDRWKYTKQANDSVSNIAASVLRMFGMGG